MSDVTLKAINEAIAAHVAEESEGESLLLTDWHVTIAAAIANNPDRTMYFNAGPNTPYHHRLGLMHRGLEMLVQGDDD